MTLFEETIQKIQFVNMAWAAHAKSRLDSLTKPQGSLGRLEEIAIRCCLIQNTDRPTLGAKRIYVFAGDHGVADEGVSAFPKAVTCQMVHNMQNGGAAINVLAKHEGAEVKIVDMGVDGDFNDAPGIINRKRRRGTGNITKGPAMEREEVTAALEAGISLAQDARADGITLLGTGDMGIANTTSSAALLTVLLPCEARHIVGRGTGIDDEMLRHKTEVVDRAVHINKARLTDPVGVLAALGGLEIAGIAGLILGAAALRLPVVVDGFISSAAALAACKLAPAARDYLFFSHCSAEAGHRLFFERMETEPLLDLRMRLGEGTGAALAFNLVEAAVKIYNEMATFDGAHVSTGIL